MKLGFASSIAALGLSGCLMLSISSAHADAAGCQLTAADFSSLQRSNSHISSQSQVDALSERLQKSLCDTLAKWDNIQSGGTFQNRDFYDISPDYLSPEEHAAWAKLMAAAIDVRLRHMSPEEWARLHQQIVDEASGR